jgi:hypothetical protein
MSLMDKDHQDQLMVLQSPDHLVLDMSRQDQDSYLVEEGRMEYFHLHLDLGKKNLLLFQAFG